MPQPTQLRSHRMILMANR